MGLLFVALAILAFFVWLGALIHMLRNPAIQGTEKIVWALVIIFLQVLGAIVYFCIAPSPQRYGVRMRR